MLDENKNWRYLKDDEAAALLQEVPDVWRLPIRLLHVYGLRVSEVLGLTSRNLQDGELVIKRLKRGRVTRQYVSPEIGAELQALIASKAPGVRLFPWRRESLWRILQQAGNRLGLDPKKLHPHALRHGAGRRWARMGGSLVELNAMLGHSPRSFSATQKYIDIECSAALSKKFLV